MDGNKFAPRLPGCCTMSNNICNSFSTALKRLIVNCSLWKWIKRYDWLYELVHFPKISSNWNVDDLEKCLPCCSFEENVQHFRNIRRSQLNLERLNNTKRKLKDTAGNFFINSPKFFVYQNGFCNWRSIRVNKHMLNGWATLSMILNDIVMHW